MHPLVEARIRLASFRRVYGWLARDFLLRERWKSLLLIALNLLGVASRIAAVGIVVLFVRAQLDGSLNALGREVPVDTEPRTLLLFGLAAAAFAIASAVMTYLSEQMGFDMAQSYVAEAARRIIDRVADGVRIPEAADQTRELLRIANASMTMTLRLLIVQLGTLAAGLTALVAVAAMLFVNTPLTLVISGVVGALAIPFYLLNRRVFQAAKIREEGVRETSRLAQKTLRLLLGTAPTPPLDPSWGRRYVTDPRYLRSQGAFRKIILTRRQVAMVKEIGVGVALLLFVLGFGWLLGSDRPRWDLALVYVVALQWAATGGVRVATCMTAMSRFLPQVRRAVDFLSLPAAERGPASQVSGQALDPVCVVVPSPVHASTSRVLEALAQHHGISSSQLLSQTFVFTSGSASLESLVSEPGTETSLATFRFARTMLAEEHGNALLDGGWLTRLDERERESVLAELEGRGLILLTTTWPHPARRLVDNVLWLDDDGRLVQTPLQIVSAPADTDGDEAELDDLLEA
ncbi:MAG: hypothetical protein AAGK22_00425 [Acidobacteriota bacterium]